MLRSLYKNLRISSFVQCRYENYSAMQSNKRFNYSLVVPLLLLMWRVVLRRPGRDNWGIWVEYSALVAAHLFFFSLILVCPTVSFLLRSWRLNSSAWRMTPVDDPDLKLKDLSREEDISWWSGKPTLIWSSVCKRQRENEPTEPLKKKRSVFRFGLIYPI